LACTFVYGYCCMGADKVDVGVHVFRCGWVCAGVDVWVFVCG